MKDNKDLINFAQNNPRKDIVFNAIPTIMGKPLIEFTLKVKEKGLKGIIKSLFTRDFVLGEKKIHPTYGVQIFKNDKGPVNTDILTQFIDYTFAPIRYKFDSEIMPKSITKTQKEFERDINNLFAPPYGKISYYDSPDKNINKQRKESIEIIKKLTGETHIAGDFGYKV